jgi:hypothetical protein
MHTCLTEQMGKKNKEEKSYISRKLYFCEIVKLSNAKPILT